jgi:vacuolar iron transporter family protein
VNDHFGGKSAAEHVIEKRSEARAEAHGLEAAGHLATSIDAARDTAVALLLLHILLAAMAIPPHSATALLLAFGVGWLAWKGGRSAHLAWSRLERLHRITQQEKWEIEHHRDQERQELLALYRLKGLEGRLLEEVVDVLMADNDRLLRVMLEEEMGLSLHSYEHPLKQGVGAMVGSLCVLLPCLLATIFFPTTGLPVSAALMLCTCAGLAAHLEDNRRLAAIVWTVALAIVTAAVGYFLLQLLVDKTGVTP